MQENVREKNMGRWKENLVVGIICIIFVSYAVQAVLIEDYNRLYMVALPSLFLALLPYLFENRTKMSFPAGVKEMVALALLLHMAGGISRLYWKFAPFYDKVAHMVSALALILLVFCFFAVIDAWGKKLPKYHVLLLVVIITVIFMIGWEAGEVYIDVLVNTSYSNGIADTVGDLIGDVAGIVLGMLLIRHYLNRIPPGKTIGWLMTMR